MLLSLGTAATMIAPTLATIIALACANAVLMIASDSSFAVAWHRSVLLGEALPFGSSFRFGRREWRFFGYCLISSLIVLAPTAILMLILQFLAFGWTVLLGAWLSPAVTRIGAGVVSALIGATVGARLMLVMPAVAVDEGRPYMSRAWNRGRHHSIQLICGVLLCAVPIGLIGVGVSFASRPLIAANLLAQALIEVVLLAVNFVGWAVSIGFLSLAYQQLRDHHPQA